MRLSRSRPPLRLVVLIGLIAALLPAGPLPAAAEGADGKAPLAVAATTTDHLATPLGVDNPAPARPLDAAAAAPLTTEGRRK